MELRRAPIWSSDGLDVHETGVGVGDYRDVDRGVDVPVRAYAFALGSLVVLGEPPNRPTQRPLAVIDPL